MNKLISFLLGKSSAVFFITLIAALFLCINVKNLQIEAKSTSFFLENDSDLQAFYKSIKSFGDQDFLVLAYKNDKDIFEPENIKKLQNIEANLLKIKDVKSTLSILNAPLFLSNAKSINDGANLQNAKEEISKNKIYMNNLISRDFLVSDFLINAKISDELINNLRKFANENGLILGGMSVIANDMVSYIKSDLLHYGIELFVLLSIAIFIFFRSIYFVFVCMAICLISLLSTTGLLALLGYAITVISSNYVALVLIITISVIVHLLSHFSELLAKNRFSDKNTLIRHTLLAKAKPSFFAILTTVVGFLSLVFSGIKPISELGIMMSIGISVSLVLCYLFLPYLLQLKKQIKGRSLQPKLLEFCANTAINHRKIVYFVSVVILLFSAFAIPKITAENSFVNYFKDSSEIKKGLLLIDEKLGGTLPLDVIIHFANETKNSDVDDEFADFLDDEKEYFLTPEKLELLEKIHNLIASQKYVGSVLSLHSLVDFAKQINKGEKVDAFMLNMLENSLSDETKAQIITPYYNENEHSLRLAIRMIDSDKTLKRAEFIANLKEKLAPFNNDAISVEISGVMVLYNNMLSSLVSSQVDTLSFVVLSIFVLFLLIFRNFRFSVIGILANVVPLSLLFALIGFSGLSLDLMSITIAAISIGIGVDDIIHYVQRFKIEIKHRPLNEAILASHKSIGAALYYTTCTIVLGFCLMMSSNFLPTIYFGLLTVLVMILLLCGSLFLLPSLIISFHFKGYFKNEFKGNKC